MRRAMGEWTRTALAHPETGRLYRWYCIMVPRRGHAFGRALHRARRKMFLTLARDLAGGGTDGE